MKGTSQNNNGDPIIMRKNIALVECRRKRRSAREESSYSEEDSDDDHGSTSTRESRSRRHERSRRHRSRSRHDSRSRRRRRDDSSKTKGSRSKREKMNIDHLQKGGGEMTLHQNTMRRTSPRTDLPSNLNHKRSMTKKGFGHHCLHQQRRLRHRANRHRCQLYNSDTSCPNGTNTGCSTGTSTGCPNGTTTGTSTASTIATAGISTPNSHPKQQ